MKTIDLPLNPDSYPEELAKEISQAVRAVLESPPVPQGEPEPGLFPEQVKTELPEIGVALLGVAGKPRSGKDVLAEYLTSHYQGVTRLNFSDPIIHEVNQWLSGHHRKITPQNKSHPLHRKLLQVWGRARRQENPAYWVDLLRETINASNARLTIVCGVRAPSDLQLIEELGGRCLYVERPGNTYQAEDPIESALQNHKHRMTMLENPQENQLQAYTENIDALIRELAA